MGSFSFQHDALGFVEIFGLIAATEVADVMLKSANVTVKSICNADAGLITVVCEGDLAACKAAVDAGRAAGTRLGALIGSNLIGRPLEDTVELITGHVGTMFPVTAAPAAKAAKGKKK